MEIRRYKKIPAESRFCQLCKSGKVEDEIHFITECHVFTDERNMLFYNTSKVCNFLQFVKSPEVYMAF